MLYQLSYAGCSNSSFKNEYSSRSSAQFRPPAAHHSPPALVMEGYFCLLLGVVVGVLVGIDDWKSSSFMTPALEDPLLGIPL